MAVGASERPVLDWRPCHDPESLEHPIRPVLRSLAPTVTKMPSWKVWGVGPVLDQGVEGACVGHGWTAELLADPVPVPWTHERAQAYAFSSYQRMKLIDEFPGENYEGTSVNAGAKIMREDGHIGSYRWSFSFEDLRDTILLHGPVVIGVWWYESMFEPLPTGLVTVEGKKVGGHCLLVRGYYRKARLKVGGPIMEVFRLRQSWGPKHGLNGDIFITAKDLWGLLRDGGEACVPEHRQLVSP